MSTKPPNADDTYNNPSKRSLQDKRFKELAAQRKREFEIGQQFVATQKRRVRAAEQRYQDQAEETRHWRSRARLWMLAASVATTLTILLAGERFFGTAPENPSGQTVTQDYSWLLGQAEAERNNARRLAEQTRRALSQAHWSAGVAARDRAAAPLAASHHFFRSATLSNDPADARNALLAGALLLAPYHLEQVFFQTGISTAAFSHDQSRILTWSENGVARLWDTRTGQALEPPLQHRSKIYGAVFSADDGAILTWSEDGAARLWDTAGGKLRFPALIHAGEVFGAAFNASESRILSWGADGAVRLWDAQTGDAIVPPLKHPGHVTGAIFSDDEQRILSWYWNPFPEGDQSGAESGVQIWDIASGTSVIAPIRQPGRINGARFNRDESRFLIWSSDGTARVRDSTTGTAITPALKHDDWVNGALFLGTGARVLSWSEDFSLRLRDGKTGKATTPTMRHAGVVNGALLDPAERRILSWSLDGTVRLWDATTGAALADPMQHDDRVLGAAFDPAAELILSWSEDGSARLWDGWTGRPLGAPLLHGAAVLGAVFDPSGASILSWSRDGMVRLWRRHDQPLPGAPSTETIIADTVPVLRWNDAEQAQLSDPQTGETTVISLPREDWIDGARLSADGSRLAVWGGDLFGGIAHLRDTATGQPLTPLLRHRDRVTGMRFSPDGNRLLSWSEDGSVKLWDTTTGDALSPPLRHAGRAASALFSADGKRILSWALNGAARLWDGRNGQALSAPLRHPGGAYQVSFNTDGSRILVRSLEGEVRAWDITIGANWTEQPVRRLEITTGTRLDGFDTLELLDITAWRALHAE